MPTIKITKRVVDAAEPRASRYAIYDSVLPGFGLRVYPSGQKTWVFDYRPGGGGRGVHPKRMTIGLAASPDGKKTPDYTPDGARKEAERYRAIVLTGGDPQGEKTGRRQAPTLADVVDLFLTKHVEPKRKASTAKNYRDILERLVLPELGNVKAAEVKRAEVSKLHFDLRATPFQANRVLAVLSKLYGFAGGDGLVPEGFNPARGVEKFKEHTRGDQLDAGQLERLGAAIREAETTGIPWIIDPTKKLKHMQKTDRVTRISEHAAAALRLLLFTGTRLGEVLNLKWEHVDFERGLLLFPEHKTSRTKGGKTVVLNAPALDVLARLSRVGVYVIAGESAGEEDERPRADLKKPWALVRDRAGLDGVRLHDLRHNFASFGAGGGLGLPIIGKLLGHSQPATTARYSHLDNDPLRRASNTIGNAIAAALGEAPESKDNVVPITRTK